MARLLKNMNWGVFSAIIALIGVLLFETQMDQPTSTLKSSEKTDAEYQAEVDESVAMTAHSESELQKSLWGKSRDEVGPAAMAWVSDTARKHIIDVRSFRPQRSSTDAGLEQLNFLVIAEGNYPAVMTFIKEFESADSLLSIKLLQIGSIDGASDAVRVSLGLVAYMEEEENG